MLGTFDGWSFHSGAGRPRRLAAGAHAPAGPEFIRAADGDVFDESNLDRQLLSSPLRIGQSKAAAAQERAAFVAPQIRFEAVPEFMTKDNCARLLSGCRLALGRAGQCCSPTDAGARLRRARAPAGARRRGRLVFRGRYRCRRAAAARRVYPGGREPERTRTHSSVVSACAAVQAAEAEKAPHRRRTGALGPAAHGRSRLDGDTRSKFLHILWLN